MLKKLLELHVVHVLLSKSSIYRFWGETGRHCLNHIAWWSRAFHRTRDGSRVMPVQLKKSGQSFTPVSLCWHSARILQPEPDWWLPEGPPSVSFVCNFRSAAEKLQMLSIQAHYNQNCPFQWTQMGSMSTKNELHVACRASSEPKLTIS